MSEIKFTRTPTMVVAEGARVGIVVCRRCGAAVLLDARDPDDAMELHRNWHSELEEVFRFLEKQRRLV